MEEEEENQDLGPPNHAFPCRYRERRRLPSPISEGDDALLSPMNGAGQMMERLGVGGQTMPIELTSDAHVEVDVRGAAAELMDIEGEDQLSDRQRRGRSRSRRADGKDSVADERGIAPSLYMGYRASCERCRARVPGHYMHILKG